MVLAGCGAHQQEQVARTSSKLGRLTGRGWGADYGEPAVESSAGVWWAGRTGWKDGLEWRVDGLAVGLNLGAGDERGIRVDSGSALSGRADAGACVL